MAESKPQQDQPPPPQEAEPAQSPPRDPRMTETPVADSARKTPSWFTPKRLLIIFCVINMLNYVDRGAIASNGVNGSIGICDKSGICTGGTGIQGDFKLSNFQNGALSSAFMVGLLVASPIFASLSKSHNPFRLIGVGLSVWTFAAAGCGGSFNFWTIAICRMLVGVGEASFISLAAPFIDDHAPAPRKTAWLAIFYMCIPTGIAVGYVYGGYVGNNFSWRFAFWGEAFCMLPFCVLAFAVKPLKLRGSEVPDIDDCGVVLSDKASLSSPASKSFNQLRRFSKDMKELLLHKVYVVNVLGYVLYNFVIGAYSYWGPKAGYSIYHMRNPDLMFGVITIVCGILGTLAGGLLLDTVSATIYNAFKLLSGATFLGAIFCFSAFCVRSLYGFVVLFLLGELLVFATQAPVNYVCLRCVKPSLRPLSMAVSTVSIHIFGDVPSSPLAGLLQDHVNSWRVTTLAVTVVLFLASGMWFIGIFVSKKDKFDEDVKEEVPTAVNDRKMPLIEEKTEGARDSGEA